MADDNRDTTDETTMNGDQAQQATPVHPMTPTEMNRDGTKPAGSASMGVDNPANDPTTNDTTQTQEDRLAEARSTAMANHAAAQGLDSADQSSQTEEEIA